MQQQELMEEAHDEITLRGKIFEQLQNEPDGSTITADYSDYTIKGTDVLEIMVQPEDASWRRWDINKPAEPTASEYQQSGAVAEWFAKGEGEKPFLANGGLSVASEAVSARSEIFERLQTLPDGVLIAEGRSDFTKRGDEVLEIAYAPESEHWSVWDANDPSRLIASRDHQMAANLAEFGITNPSFPTPTFGEELVGIQPFADTSLYQATEECEIASQRFRIASDLQEGRDYAGDLSQYVAKLSVGPDTLIDELRSGNSSINAGDLQFYLSGNDLVMVASRAEYAMQENADAVQARVIDIREMNGLEAARVDHRPTLVEHLQNQPAGATATNPKTGFQYRLEGENVVAMRGGKDVAQMKIEDVQKLELTARQQRAERPQQGEYRPQQQAAFARAAQQQSSGQSPAAEAALTAPNSRSHIHSPEGGHPDMDITANIDNQDALLKKVEAGFALESKGEVSEQQWTETRSNLVEYLRTQPEGTVFEAENDIVGEVTVTDFRLQGDELHADTQSSSYREQVVYDANTLEVKEPQGEQQQSSSWTAVYDSKVENEVPATSPQSPAQAAAARAEAASVERRANPSPAVDKGMSL